MDFLADPVILARIQFAFTAMYHFLLVPVSIGLGLIMAIYETRAYRSGKEEDAAAARFWLKIFTATFALGVATGSVRTGRITHASWAISSVLRWQQKRC